MAVERFPERTALLATAKRLAVTIEAEAEASERVRTLTPAVVDALRKSELQHAALPSELGGLEADPLTLLELVEEISRQDGSAGWCFGMTMVMAGISAAHLPEAGAQAIFGSGPVSFAGGFPPQGRAVADEGGWRASGRFVFGSGSGHADWIVCCCLEVDDAGKPRIESNGMPAMRAVCVPIEQVELHDNWDVAGLEATASCDYSLHDVHVAEAFSFPVANWRALRNRGVFGLPLLSVAAAPHIGFALGVGRRALEEITAHATWRQRLGSSSKLAERPGFQQAYARAETRLRAARALAFEALGAMFEAHAAGERVALSQRADVAAATANAYAAAVEAATFAFRAGGGSALFRSGRLQCCFRDIQAGAQHIVVSDESWERIAQVWLGVGEPQMI